MTRTHPQEEQGQELRRSRGVRNRSETTLLIPLLPRRISPYSRARVQRRVREGSGSGSAGPVRVGLRPRSARTGAGSRSLRERDGSVNIVGPRESSENSGIGDLKRDQRDRFQSLSPDPDVDLEPPPPPSSVGAGRNLCHRPFIGAGSAEGRTVGAVHEAVTEVAPTTVPSQTRPDRTMPVRKKGKPLALWRSLSPVAG